jgi:hypothetical protein
MAGYVSDDAFLGLAAAHGFARVAPDALSKFDAFVYHITKSALDLVSLVTPARTVQPAHFATLERIADLMREPVVAGRRAPPPTTTKMTGGAIVLPPSYFGRAEPAGAYSMAASGNSGAADIGAAVARPAAVSTYGPSQLLMMGGGGGGGGGGFVLSNEALVRLLRDYRARTRSDVLVSEPAKARLKRVIELNVDAAVRQLRRGCKASGGRKGPPFTGKALERTAARWVLVLR